MATRSRERFSNSSKNEMMQFDDRERCRDRTIRCDAHGHFAFDREAGEVVEIQDVTVFFNLTLEKQVVRIGPCMPNCCTVPVPVQPTL